MTYITLLSKLDKDEIISVIDIDAENTHLSILKKEILLQFLGNFIYLISNISKLKNTTMSSQ